jgi:hypothetical protein
VARFAQKSRRWPERERWLKFDHRESSRTRRGRSVSDCTQPPCAVLNRPRRERPAKVACEVNQ